MFNLGMLLLLSSALGTYVTLFMGRRLVKSINFYPKKNELEIEVFNFFCRTRYYQLKWEDIKPLEQKLRYDSTVQYTIVNEKLKKYKYISTYGTGKWCNKTLFPFLQHRQGELIQLYEDFERGNSQSASQNNDSNNNIDNSEEQEQQEKNQQEKNTNQQKQSDNFPKLKNKSIFEN